VIRYQYDLVFFIEITESEGNKICIFKTNPSGEIVWI